jgi:hypothetical protein
VRPEPHSENSAEDAEKSSVLEERVVQLCNVLEGVVDGVMSGRGNFVEW